MGYGDEWNPSKLVCFSATNGLAIEMNGNNILGIFWVAEVIILTNFYKFWRNHPN